MTSLIFKRHETTNHKLHLGLSFHFLTVFVKVTTSILIFFGYTTDYCLDDYYKGMLIPKGSTIIIGMTALHFNDKTYSDAASFNPDRFLGYTKLANDYAGSPDWEHRDKCTPIAYSHLANLSSFTSLWVRRRSAYLSRHTFCRTKYVENCRKTTLGIRILACHRS